MWKTTNYKGEAVTWYSEEEYNKLLNALERIFFEYVDNAYQVAKDVLK